MESLEKMSASLIDIKDRIRLINDKDTFALNLSDLRCFSGLRKIDCTSFEKIHRNAILSVDNHSFIFKLIVADIKLYLTFYNKYQNELKLVNKSSIVENNLTYQKRRKDIAYENLKKISSKLGKVENTIKNSRNSFSDNSDKILLLEEQEMKINKEKNRLNDIYLEEYNYYNKKYHEYSVYTLFEFENIYNEFKEIIELTNSYNRNILDDTINIVNFGIVHTTYELTKSFFVYKIRANELLNRLNLRMQPEERIIKKSYVQKFLYIIKKIEKLLDLPKEELDRWVKELLNLWDLKLSTYNKGGLVNSTFKEEVDKAFSHLEKD